MFVTHNGLTIYFGDASDSLYPCAYLALPKEKNILANKPFAQFQQLFNINQLIFLKQIHSTKGLIISHGQSAPPSFNFTGDFLITNVPTIGIGIMTADCLPIIIYDPIHHIIALIHAGWKGTINNIALLVVTKMQKLFNTDLASIQIIFGPSAKQCCYTVQENFVVQVKKNQLINCKKVFYRKNNALFFDLPGCNQDLLEKIGIKKNVFYFTYNVCTICNNQYFSHRRQGDHAGRQMTVISFQ